MVLVGDIEKFLKFVHAMGPDPKLSVLKSWVKIYLLEQCVFPVCHEYHELHMLGQISCPSLCHEPGSYLIPTSFQTTYQRDQ